MSQTLHSDEIEMWHGHPDLYKNNLEKFRKILKNS